MCSSCSNMQKKLVSLGFSAFLILFAITLGVLWPSMSTKVLHDKLMVKNGSSNYNNWIRTPIPMYLEVYFFNWSNAHLHADASVKPHFTEMGPYTFSEVHERVNLMWNTNNTVTYNQRRTWHFVPELSNGSLDDSITNLNVISLNVAYLMRDVKFPLDIPVKTILETHGSFLWKNKTVRELLFDGVDDPLLDLIRTLPDIRSKVPFDRFGWFYGRNLSETFDGSFTMRTGADDIESTGLLTQWNGAARTGMYRGRCGAVYGTSGELWPPYAETPSNITLFPSDICRSVTLQKGEPVSLYNVQGVKYIGDGRVFDNGVTYPEAACWCNADPQHCPDLKPGIFNASACKYGSPTFVSFPHFYLADESYQTAVDGMRPNRTVHEFYMAIETKTGIPLDVRAQLQINEHLQLIKTFSMYKNAPDVMVPMLWFRQRATLTQKLAEQAKLALALPTLGIYVAFFFGSIGVIMGCVFLYLAIRKWTPSTDIVPYEELAN
ncbi:protein croquemort-like [Anopheles cruzii]|uniref:protein croquemort-like n=1 Tax=Anopheles cruzii TaxID=68878 RepID=UPI0022EC30A7|nr:protein croquemort-like [Anopheles cruzii]